ncbi:kinase-like domain-containing protein [Fusarium avenaceum]|nr:kinase-like domain-containing protein [Fusarium avenaceum]
MASPNAYPSQPRDERNEDFFQFVRHTQLPVLDPGLFGDDPTQMNMMRDFCSNQWRFCPVIFSNSFPFDQRTIDARQILPIRSEETIGSKAQNSKTLIRVVTLYDGCYDTSWSPSGTIVFKVYNKEVLRRSWTQEFNAFVSIDSCEHIVQYLGSFEQNHRYFIILEHAGGGSLQHLFSQDVRPTTFEQCMYFWRGLMGLTKAINTIQNLGGGPHTQRTGFAHRDINPANILVFPARTRCFLLFKMKLADFDTATSIHRIADQPFTHQDNDGAPEASPNNEEEEET